MFYFLGLVVTVLHDLCRADFMKNNFYPAGILATALLTQATPAVAQSDAGFFDVGFGGAAYVGTLGVGGQGAIALNPNFSVAGGVDFATIDLSIEDSLNVPFTDGASLNVTGVNPYVVAGFHPFGNDIRLAGGVALSHRSQ